MRRWLKAVREKRDLDGLFLEATAEIFQLRKALERITTQSERDRVEFYTERRKLQRDLQMAMECNASLALDLAARDFELSQLKEND